MPNLKKIHIKDMNKNVKDIVDKNISAKLEYDCIILCLG